MVSRQELRFIRIGNHKYIGQDYVSEGTSKNGSKTALEKAGKLSQL